MGKSQKPAKKKDRRSKHNAAKYDRQWYRTAKNKLKRINHARALANLPLLKSMTFKDKKGASFLIHA